MSEDRELFADAGVDFRGCAVGVDEFNPVGLVLGDAQVAGFHSAKKRLFFLLEPVYGLEVALGIAPLESG